VVTSRAAGGRLTGAPRRRPNRVDVPLVRF